MVSRSETLLSQCSDPAHRNEKGPSPRRTDHRSNTARKGQDDDDGKVGNRIADGAGDEGVCLSRMFGEDEGRGWRCVLDGRQSFAREQKTQYFRIENKMSISLELERFN